MKHYDLIQVLWVEDDKSIINQLKKNAFYSGLELVAYPCWDDAKEALESDYDRWSAIILDAKCKHHRDSADSAVVFLREALMGIAVLAEKKNRVIPWYVLTGGDTSEVSDSINEERLKWDKDWTESTNKKYYSKNTDTEMLYNRIRYHANVSPRLQLQKIYYDALEQLEKINRDSYDIILNIFESMHFPKSHPDFNPILYYNQLRQILEYVYIEANKVAIIPDECISSTGEVNLSQCCHYLSGNDATVLKIRYGERGERVVPKHIQDMMVHILTLGNINSHASRISEEEEHNLKNYINENVYNSRFLIYSLALQLCEIVMWMNRYIANHPNKDENQKKCVKLESIEGCNKEISEDEKIGVVDFDGSLYHLGENFLLNKSLIENKGWLGKKVKVVEFDKNKKNNKYPFFAFKIQPVKE